ncbi:helix-turn-helix domain-containing protein [Actinophytocola oryzae]|uniref:DNA-binding XRE family transcriptional regulator n=1 Tax=Actinophytocola oryzae TaxID=502181 RepID=A0A4R7UV68_9PSEU|nr:helix-turn-helix transcriptional regulator [Actinophytocola oryzae]TDV40340.1 DNA-binding XRE family transcriptional regulator [Actinophytocola oryzae]
MHVGTLLREWRHQRRLSQLELASQAGVSTRHLSFVETGRTAPSRAMVLHLADHLDVPLRDRNALLVAAGFAPAYREEPAAAQAMLDRVLTGHEPHPALAVDDRWYLVQANRSAEIFFAGVAPALLEPPVNMMRLGLHPDGFAPRLRNLAQVRAFLLPRLARQAARTGDPELRALHEELLTHGEPGEPPEPTDIALPIEITHRGVDLTFINTITTFGTAFDMTLAEIAIETYLPADERTAAFLTTHTFEAAE